MELVLIIAAGIVVGLSVVRRIDARQAARAEHQRLHPEEGPQREALLARLLWVLIILAVAAGAVVHFFG